MNRRAKKGVTRATLVSLGLLATRRLVRRFVERVGAALWLRTFTVTPGRILFAPETLLPCDAEVAADIYAGVFALDGETLDAAGHSPFALTPPSPRWARALHGFSWLIHLEANASALSSTNARALVDEWLSAKSAGGALANEPSVVVERVMAWLVESPLLLDGADTEFRVRFMRGLGRQLRRLERRLGELPADPTKVKVVGALALAGTVISDQTRLQRWALSLLSEVLSAQVLPDGGHASRNPEALVALLTTLLPLREALLRRQLPVPTPLSATIDKMLPMVRFFRHQDGSVAAFHGARPVPPRLIEAIDGYDDAKGQPSDNARYSGFQRLEAGAATLIVDTGRPPPPLHARTAAASALAFEFSHTNTRLIVNCGALGDAQPSWANAARATAAHSTLTLTDRSSARILRLWPLSSVLGPVLFAGPYFAKAERDGRTVRASHDGYRDQFGIIHERTLTLSDDGRWLNGEDKIVGPDKLVGAPFAVRFHLGEGVRVRLDKARRHALLRLPDGAIWLFSLNTGPGLAVEESLVLAGRRTLARTAQIVISGNTLTDDTVRWHIARHAEPLGQNSGTSA